MAAMSIRKKILDHHDMVREVSMRVWKLFTLLIVLCLLWSPLHAEMRAISDEMLSEITGEGFCSFTMQGGVVRADFDITASTRTHVDRLQMGYWDNGSGLGWDQDWEDVDFGYISNLGINFTLTCNGLFFEAGFSNITDPNSRQLEYLRVGSPSVDGRIRADFRSFTGTIGGTTYTRADRGPLLGTKYSIRPNGDYLYFELNRASGWSVNAGPSAQMLR